MVFILQLPFSTGRNLIGGQVLLVLLQQRLTEKMSAFIEPPLKQFARERVSFRVEVSLKSKFCHASLPKPQEQSIRKIHEPVGQVLAAVSMLRQVFCWSRDQACDNFTASCLWHFTKICLWHVTEMC